jgi:hypothetical protein
MPAGRRSLPAPDGSDYGQQALPHLIVHMVHCTVQAVHTMVTSVPAMPLASSRLFGSRLLKVSLVRISFRFPFLFM